MSRIESEKIAVRDYLADDKSIKSISRVKFDKRGWSMYRVELVNGFVFDVYTINRDGSIIVFEPIF